VDTSPLPYRRRSITPRRQLISFVKVRDGFTVADIATVIAFDLAKVLKTRVTDETPPLKRWYGPVSARPSAAA